MHIQWDGNTFFLKEKSLFLYESIYEMAIEKFLYLKPLVDFNRNTISEWAVGIRCGNFILKLARGKEKPRLWPLGSKFFSCGLRFGGEEISIPYKKILIPL